MGGWEVLQLTCFNDFKKKTEDSEILYRITENGGKFFGVELLTSQYVLVLDDATPEMMEEIHDWLKQKNATQFERVTTAMEALRR